MLSIIIPAYNEEERIKATLTKVFDFLDNNNIESEVIVVDDGSQDDTVRVVEEMKKDNLRLLKNGNNRGKGYSVKKGMLNAKGELLLFSDADLSTPIEELKQFLEHSDKADVLVAARNLEGSEIKIKQPFFRSTLGKIFPFFVKHFLIKGISDTQCGFKMFKRGCAMDIFKKQRVDGWSFDAEILFIASKHNYRIKQLPVEWNNDTRSKINSFTDPPKMLLELLKIRLNNILGRYSE